MAWRSWRGSAKNRQLSIAVRSIARDASPKGRCGHCQEMGKHCSMWQKRCWSRAFQPQQDSTTKWSEQVWTGIWTKLRGGRGWRKRREITGIPEGVVQEAMWRASRLKGSSVDLKRVAQDLAMDEAAKHIARLTGLPQESLRAVLNGTQQEAGPVRSCRCQL